MAIKSGSNKGGRACLAPVRAATGKAFTDDEIEALVDRLIRRAARKSQQEALRGQAEALKAAAREMTLEDVSSALQSQRARLKSKEAKLVREGKLAAMTRGDAADRIEALLIGRDDVGFGGKSSTDALMMASAAEGIGFIDRGIDATPGLRQQVNRYMRDVDFETDVAVEMARLNGGQFKATGNELAVAAAKVFGDALEKSRQKLNAAGAWVGKLDGYVARQEHDALKVMGGFFKNSRDPKAIDAARTRWKDYIRPLLSERTFDGVEDVDAFLDGIFTNIVSGKADLRLGAEEVEGFLPKSGVARTLSAERVLHFKAPQDWMTYHNEFGRGSLFAVITRQVMRSNENAALMTFWGPNPDVAFSNTLAEARKAAREAGNVVLDKKLGHPKMQAAFEALTGEAERPENLKLAMTMKLMRQHQSVAKLGGMVLSAFGDIQVAQYHLHRSGVPWLESYGRVFQGILGLQSKERKIAARALDAGARMAVGRMTSGIRVSDGAMGFYSAAARANMALQGFTHWMDGMRSGIAGTVSGFYGGLADKGFDQLPASVRETFDRYGVEASDWQALRRAMLDSGLPKGERMLVLDGVPEATALKMRTLMQDILDDATSEGRARERRDLSLGGMKPGTGMGEAVRAFTQFWSFSVTFINRTLAPAIDQARQGQALPLVTLILGMTTFGYASLVAKDLAKGREPRPVTWKTVIAAMVQGGGMGIYGDFLFGEHNRFGGGLLETLGGPIIGDFSALWQLWMRMYSGEDGTGSAIQLAKGQLPMANLWYTRAALDYLLWWRVQEAVDPGWAARYEARVARENDQEFIVGPTDAVN